MNKKHSIHISELSCTKHVFDTYHFCRGNSGKRKSRFGLIQKGSGFYMYLNHQIAVSEGDIIFIPEKLFCYSEWQGNPEIEVTYINCFMNYDRNICEYELQKLPASQWAWDTILQICDHLNGDTLDELKAYSLMYDLLYRLIPSMKESTVMYDCRLNKAVKFIMDHWNENISVEEMAEAAGVSQSKLFSLFKEQLGQSPVSYLNAIKINYAMQYLESGDYTLAEVCQMTNFHSESYFRRVFLSITGCTPAKFLKGNRKK